MKNRGVINNNQTRFSILIPTRNRHETLSFAIKTCLEQNFENYEIVVCDNNSSSETREVIEKLSNIRIKYIRSNKTLAMSSNWELAVSHAKGEFVIIIGDDDGLLPDALINIDRILHQTKTNVLRWDRVCYSWPSIPDGSEPNRVEIPMREEFEYINGEEIIMSVANYRDEYTKLPMLYNSAIHIDLINESKSYNGYLFATWCPDIYSGFVFAYLSKEYVSTKVPMSINGRSIKSNGFIEKDNNYGDTVVQKEFYHLSKMDRFNFHLKAPNIRHISAEIANNFYYAKEIMFPTNTNLFIDRKNLIINLMRSLNYISPTRKIWDKHIKELRRSINDDINLLSWFDSNISDTKFNKLSTIGGKDDPLGFNGSILKLDVAKFNIFDVHGVSKLSKVILGDMKKIKLVETKTNLNFRQRIRAAARIIIKGR